MCTPKPWETTNGLESERLRELTLNSRVEDGSEWRGDGNEDIPWRLYVITQKSRGDLWAD